MLIKHEKKRQTVGCAPVRVNVCHLPARLIFFTCYFILVLVFCRIKAQLLYNAWECKRSQNTLYRALNYTR